MPWWYPSEALTATAFTIGLKTCGTGVLISSYRCQMLRGLLCTQVGPIPGLFAWILFREVSAPGSFAWTESREVPAPGSFEWIELCEVSAIADPWRVSNTCHAST